MWVVMLQKITTVPSFQVEMLGLFFSVETAKLAAYHDTRQPIYWKHINEHDLYISSPTNIGVDYKIQKVHVKEHSEVKKEIMDEFLSTGC